MARSSDRRRIAGHLHSAAIRVLRHAREADRKSPVGAAQLSALSVLTFGGPCSIGELAASEQVTPPTMTRVAHALERQKLVRLTASPDDGRVTIAQATPKGIALLAKAREERLNRIETLLAEKDPADVALLGRALARVFPATLSP
jgi:DNA-binding MarR family transcriptional regulator